MGDLRKMFVEEIAPDVVRVLLRRAAPRMAGRPAELVQLASGWRFRTRPEYLRIPAFESGKAAEIFCVRCSKHGRSSPYRQPVTRGDIEDIRGVTVATQVIKALEERGWSTPSGIAIPWGPALFATTKKFLDDPAAQPHRATAAGRNQSSSGTGQWLTNHDAPLPAAAGADPTQPNHSEHRAMSLMIRQSMRWEQPRVSDGVARVALGRRQCRAVVVVAPALPHRRRPSGCTRCRPVRDRFGATWRT